MTAISSTVTLILIAIAAYVLWILEVLYHGWDGLKWISYFHYAVPVSIGMFIVWAVLSVNVRRTAVGAVLTLFAIAGCMVYDYALTYHFMAGPSAAIAFSSEWDRAVKSNVIYPVVLGTPLALTLCLRLVPMSIGPGRVLVSSALFAASPVLAYVMLVMLQRFGDPIHVIKTGLAVPFLVVSLGILFIPRRERLRQGATPDASGVGDR